jgi:rRNA maturation endonuclease Nob1
LEIEEVVMSRPGGCREEIMERAREKVRRKGTVRRLSGGDSKVRI